MIWLWMVPAHSSKKISHFKLVTNSVALILISFLNNGCRGWGGGGGGQKGLILLLCWFLYACVDFFIFSPPPWGHGPGGEGNFIISIIYMFQDPRKKVLSPISILTVKHGKSDNSTSYYYLIWQMINIHNILFECQCSEVMLPTQQYWGTSDKLIWIVPTYFSSNSEENELNKSSSWQFAITMCIALIVPHI